MPHPRRPGSECHAVGVYEVVSGPPSWSRLYKLACEQTARLALTSIAYAVSREGRVSKKTYDIFDSLRSYFLDQLPPALAKDVLDLCLALDRFRCHHNPTCCLVLELWQVFYSKLFSDVTISHHAFAFSKTTNYPGIVLNLERLLDLIAASQGRPDAKADEHRIRGEHLIDCAGNLALRWRPPTNHCADGATVTSVTSFKLELKQCEVVCFLQDKVVQCVAKLAVASVGLRVLDIPDLASDELLNVIAFYCTNLEVLNIRGSSQQVSDAGFCHFVDTLAPEARAKLYQLDISRCMLSHQILASLEKLGGLRDLRISTRILDEVSFGCDDASDVGDVAVLPGVESVSVENENVEVSINKVMTSLRHLFPAAKHVTFTNCNACELHVTLTQQPTNITYMRQHIHTLDLVSADYFHFPRLVYPCPNLESLHIEKPTNDIFNIDAADVPFLYGNTVPFVNLKKLRLSRVSLTNLSHFLSKSSNLKHFKVTNIGRRDRPRWTDDRVQQILSPNAVPFLEEFHVSCLPHEGFSTVESHRCLHLTKATIQYLAENFLHLKRIAGVESWTRDCTRDVLTCLLNSDVLNGRRFTIVSM